MAIERKNPLPAGRYWIDVIDYPPGHMNEFTAWALANDQKIAIESTEERTELDPHQLFVIFRVLEPVFFPQKNFGFPNIAGEQVHTSDDTAQKPDVPEPSFEGPAGQLVTFGGLALGAAALLFLAKLIGRK